MQQAGLSDRTRLLTKKRLCIIAVCVIWFLCSAFVVHRSITVNAAASGGMYSRMIPPVAKISPWCDEIAPGMCGPQIIVGGAMKCGTNTIGSILSRQGSVRLKECSFAAIRRMRAQGDEPDLYCQRGPRVVYEMNSLTHKFHQSLSHYVRAMARTDGVHNITFDKSPSYFDVQFHPDVPARVARLLPSAKIIFSLCDPVARAYSEWAHLKRQNRTTRQAERGSFSDLMQAMKLEHPEECIEDCEYLRLQYLEKGEYANHLQRWFAHIPRQQILVLSMEDPHVESKVLAFTGLAQESDFGKLPQKSATYSFGSREQMKNEDEAVVERLAKIFMHSNERLSSVISETFPLEWNRLYLTKELTLLVEYRHRRQRLSDQNGQGSGSLPVCMMLADIPYTRAKRGTASVTESLLDNIGGGLKYSLVVFNTDNESCNEAESNARFVPQIETLSCVWGASTLPEPLRLTHQLSYFIRTSQPTCSTLISHDWSAMLLQYHMSQVFLIAKPRRTIVHVHGNAFWEASWGAAEYSIADRIMLAEDQASAAMQRRSRGLTIFPTEYMRSTYMELGFDYGESVIIPNPLTGNQSTCSENPLVESIAFVGEVSKRKGFDICMDIVKQAVQAIPAKKDGSKWELHVYGKVSSQSFVDMQLVGLNHSTIRIVFHGATKQKDVWNSILTQWHSILVFVSRLENSPMVVTEAVQNCIPILALKTKGGLTEVLAQMTPQSTIGQILHESRASMATTLSSLLSYGRIPYPMLRISMSSSAVLEKFRSALQLYHEPLLHSALELHYDVMTLGDAVVRDALTEGVCHDISGRPAHVLLLPEGISWVSSGSARAGEHKIRLDQRRTMNGALHTSIMFPVMYAGEELTPVYPYGFSQLQWRTCVGQTLPVLAARADLCNFLDDHKLQMFYLFRFLVWLQDQKICQLLRHPLVLFQANSFNFAQCIWSSTKAPSLNRLMGQVGDGDAHPFLPDGQACPEIADRQWLAAVNKPRICNGDGTSSPVDARTAGLWQLAFHSQCGAYCILTGDILEGGIHLNGEGGCWMPVDGNVGSACKKWFEAYVDRVLKHPALR